MLRSSSSLSSTDSEEQIKSVIVKIKDIDSIFPEDYYISYIKEDLRLNSDDVGKTTSEILSGIQIKVYSSLGQFSTTPPFQKLKPIVFKAFKLLAFAFQESYENMTDEDKKIYSDEDFNLLKSSLLKLGVGDIIDFVFYHNLTITTSDEYFFQKSLSSIFSETEKINFIRTGTERIDTKSDFSHFILLYNKNIINPETLIWLKRELEKLIGFTKVSYKHLANKHPLKKQTEKENESRESM